MINLLMGKKNGELQAEAYKVQHSESNNLYCIVRPGNVYGRYDNFDPSTGMVIPSLIARTSMVNALLKVGETALLLEILFMPQM